MMMQPNHADKSMCREYSNRRKRITNFVNATESVTKYTIDPSEGSLFIQFWQKKDKIPVIDSSLYLIIIPINIVNKALLLPAAAAAAALKDSIMYF